MKKVFISTIQQKVSEKPFPKATHVAELHFYQNPHKISFKEAIEAMNDEGINPLTNTREKAYRLSIQPSLYGRSIFFVDNVISLSDKKWRLAANTAFKLAIAANLVSPDNADAMPASYTDDQFDQWHESFLAAVYMSPNNPVKCNNCNWMGGEYELVLVIDEGEPTKGRPHCKTDNYLTNYIQ